LKDAWGGVAPERRYATVPRHSGAVWSFITAMRTPATTVAAAPDRTLLDASR
jgi:hypothetical protein